MTIVPTLTPSVTGSYGLFTPENTRSSVRRPSPVSPSAMRTGVVGPDAGQGGGPVADVQLDRDADLRRGHLQVLTDSLSFSDELEIYSYTSPNLWTEYLV